jgi:hypothetical protein
MIHVFSQRYKYFLKDILLFMSYLISLHMKKNVSFQFLITSLKDLWDITYLYTEIFKYFYIHWVTLLCTMGDNPYKYCNLQWEIIHTLLSCDNIFFVHVLYVFILVLFCLLVIVQCLDFKSIKLLLLLLYC